MSQILDFLHQLITLIKTIQFQVGKSSISLTEIVQLVVAIIITFILANYLSRFLKYRGLKKIIVDQGSRYVIANFVSYGTGFFWLLIILQATGFDISILAVVGGGVGIGIGFGFQNLAKDFVSGLTLLTERKIRTGDYIFIGELRGFVTEISTRATVVKNKDGASVIIPNSHLFENQIINCHYETTAVRLILPVGVAYGSNTTLVTEVLLLSAYLEHGILHHPAPQVVFVGFGDNALNFELWVWIESDRMDLDDETLSSLYFLIEYKLRENNIHIPFPQHELWIHNSENLQKIHTSSRDIDNLPTVQNNSEINPPLAIANEPKISIRHALKKVNAFSHLNDLKLRQVIEIGQLKSLKFQEILFHENDPGDAFYIILAGSVEIYAESLAKSLAILESGNFFGEMSLMLGIPRTASVKARESTLLFAIVHENFKVLLQKNPDFHQAIIQELSTHQEELIQRRQELEKLGLLSPEEQSTNILQWVRQRFAILFNV